MMLKSGRLMRNGVASDTCYMFCCALDTLVVLLGGANVHHSCGNVKSAADDAGCVDGDVPEVHAVSASGEETDDLSVQSFVWFVGLSVLGFWQTQANQPVSWLEWIGLSV
jgi:hypothetical protein